MKVVNKCIIQALKDNDVDWIVHQVNMQGVMGSGFAKQVKKEFPDHYKEYIDRCKSGTVSLGSVYHSDNVIGVFGQKYYGGSKRHTNYSALISGIESSFMFVKAVDTGTKPKIGIPYGIGCGLGGGNWNIMYVLLEDLQTMYPDVELVLYKVEGE